MKTNPLDQFQGTKYRMCLNCGPIYGVLEDFIEHLKTCEVRQ